MRGPSSRWPGRLTALALMFVRTSPGSRIEMPTCPASPSSAASTSLTATTAAFDAAYAVVPGAATTAATEAVLTM